MKTLYVGNLDPKVSEVMLREIFSVAGQVENAKLVIDRNIQHSGLNYGFVDFVDEAAAESAITTLNGRRVYDVQIKVNWANEAGSKEKFTIFVGDVGQMNEDALKQAFSAFPSLCHVRLMKAKGFAFLSFKSEEEAQNAIETMDGKVVGQRCLRVNWATEKPKIERNVPNANIQAPSGPPLDYDMILAQSPAWQCTIYVGNLSSFTQYGDLVPLFSNYGYVVDVKMQADKGFAFIRMDTHETAAVAICHVNGYRIHNRQIKCSWGKQDKKPEATVNDPRVSYTPPSDTYYPYGQPQTQQTSSQYNFTNQYRPG